MNDNEPSKNVLGGPLQACSFDPLTGFERTGCCDAGPDDFGQHTVCARVTEEFGEVVGGLVPDHQPGHCDGRGEHDDGEGRRRPAAGPRASLRSGP